MTERNRIGRSERALPASIAAACLALLAAQLGHAQSDQDALRACATEHDDARRLACYDEAMGARKASRPGAEAAPPSASREPQATAPVAAPAPEEQFGYRGAIARKELDEKAARDPVPDEVEAVVAEIARRPRGELVLTLDNGQVWAQKAADSSRVKVGDRVKIKKASLNSFLLVLPNNRSTRVVREK